jgi:cell division protein YceG involved in septum cleavage
MSAETLTTVPMRMLPSGVTITAISNNLEEQGIIRSSFFVRVMVKVFGSYSKLKSG